MIKIKFDQVDYFSLKNLNYVPSEENPRVRNLSIDVLRGIAILLVLLHHFNIPYKLADTVLSFDVFGQSLIHAIARNGNYGVTMFFVISGFLITSHSLQRWNGLHQLKAKTFYWSRIARILPSLVLLLLIVNGLALLGLKPFINQAPNGIEVATSLTNFAALTFWMNQLIIEYGWVNYALGVLWSLSVEEVFYLSFPIACLVLKKEKWLIGFWLVFIISAPIYRFNHQGASEAYLYGYFASFDGIAIGCVAAIVAKNLTFTRPTAKFIPVTILICMVIFYLFAPIAKTNILGVSLMAFATAVLLVLSSNTWHRPLVRQPNKLTRGIASIGRHSYEVYLFHLVVLGLMKVVYVPSSVHGDVKLWLLVSFLSGTLLLSYGIARFYSNPLNYWMRQRFLKPKTNNEYKMTP